MIQRLAVLIGLALLMLSGAQPGVAQTSDELTGLKKDVEALKAGQTGLQKELEEIKALLQQQRRPAPAAAAPAPAEPKDVIVSIDGAPVMGDKDAKVTLVEFSDYQCPFCARHFSQTLPQIEAEYVKTGKVRYVFRDFPIESIHPQAVKAAEAARCAGDQGKYWEMHDRLFANQRALSPKSLGDHAQALGLDGAAFQQCLSSGKYTASVRKGVADGQKAGVRGTPTFFLGVVEAGDPTKIKAARVLRGAQSYQTFKEAIDRLLTSDKEG